MPRVRLLTVVLIVLALLTAACGAPATPPSQGAPQPAASSTPAQQPAQPAQQPAAEAKVRDTIVVAYGADPGTMDVHKTAGPALRLSSLVYDFLIHYDADGNRMPGLAESWEVAPDAKSYTFHIRKGAKFHDGTPVDAAAVKFNFDRQLNPETGAQRTKELEAKIDRIETPDDYTVVFYLKEPDVAFIGFYIGEVTNGAIISPTAIETYGDRLATNPVGSGPWRLVDWTVGQQMVFERNEDYWGDLPKAQRLVVKIIPEQSTRLVELETGNVDLVEQVDPEQISIVERNADLQLWSKPCTCLYGVWFNLARPGLDDLRVRQAINYALDVDGMVEALVGDGGVRSQGPVPIENLGHYPGIKETGYDVARAEQLLDDAGWRKGGDGIRQKDGVRMEYTLLTPQGRYVADKELSEVTQQMLSQIGIKVNLQVVEPGSIFPEYLKGEFDMVFIGGWFTDPDPARGPMYLYLGDTIYNTFNYRNDEVLALFDVIRGTGDFDKRKVLAHQAQQLIQADEVAVWMYNANILAATRKAVQNYNHNAIGFLRLNDVVVVD